MTRPGETPSKPNPKPICTLVGQHRGPVRRHRGPVVSLLVVVSALLASAAAVPAEEGCFATCSGGLTAEGDRGPAVGERAPDFRALAFDPGLGSRAEQTLASLLAERPVILAFGSYT